MLHRGGGGSVAMLHQTPYKSIWYICILLCIDSGVWWNIKVDCLKISPCSFLYISSLWLSHIHHFWTALWYINTTRLSWNQWRSHQDAEVCAAVGCNAASDACLYIKPTTTITIIITTTTGNQVKFSWLAS